MPALTVAHFFAVALLDSIAAAYTDDEERILDQIERPRGHKVATLAEVMARPVGLHAVKKAA